MTRFSINVVDRDPRFHFWEGGGLGVCMRIWCFSCFTEDDDNEEDENGGRVKKQSLATAMENNNGDGDFVNFGENERAPRIPRWGLCAELLAMEEEGEVAGAELERLWTSEIRLHQLVQGESSNVAAAAAAEDSTMEEADHDSHHKRAKVYSGLA